MFRLVDISECICDRCGARVEMHRYPTTEGAQRRFEGFLPPGWLAYGVPGYMHTICPKHRLECVDFEPAQGGIIEPGKLTYIKPDGRTE